ncbi:hypothetical protein EQW76_00535 [Rhizobium sp. rho-13.1]|uniref:hypothetical protein n=1 Tax=Rhizobium sp. rho-13.1 TaxID=2506431 RepID=UPI00115DDEFC|nr:hypothetical protein [Rhizobium sp. rho-13.1]TQX91262.1 hypothetical protein EQW76_00535 [Rhizobium sp. rho-13.1]
MSAQLEKKPITGLKFGDIVENAYASDSNPTKRGVYIRDGYRPRGQINAGKFYEFRSENGKFWQFMASSDGLTKIGSIFEPSRDLPLRNALKHVTDHLDEWSKYHSQEMTCDIAAAIHNARELLREGGAA